MPSRALCSFWRLSAKARGIRVKHAVHVAAHGERLAYLDLSTASDLGPELRLREKRVHDILPPGQVARWQQETALGDRLPGAADVGCDDGNAHGQRLDHNTPEGLLPRRDERDVDGPQNPRDVVAFAHEQHLLT